MTQDETIPVPGDTLSVALEFITEHRRQEPWVEAPHLHDSCEIVLVENGRLYLSCESRDATLPKGSLAVIAPHIAHALRGEGHTGTAYLHLGVKGLDYIAPKCDERFGIFQPGESTPELAYLLRLMHGEQQRKGVHYRAISQRLCEAAALMVLRLEGTETAQAGAGARGGRESAFVKRYIDEHFTETLTLDILASLAHINKYYLVHSFTAAYGVSPINYLVRRRIEESRYYLENTSLSISQISQQLGFSSPSYFSQRFSAYMKKNPRTWREEAQEQRAINK